MSRISPIAHSGRVSAPVFLMLGREDARVPHSQGLEYYRALKAAGKEVRVNVYDDCHPLAKAKVSADVAVNSAFFFHEVLDKK